MRISLTIIDRIILETLQQYSMTLQELESSTGLPEKVLIPAVQNLIIVNFVKVNDSFYELNKVQLIESKKQINSPEQKEVELTEIVQTCIRNTITKQNNSFNFKKVFLDSREEKIYKGLVYNLNSFLESVQNGTSPTKNKKIIFWGEDTYENITNSILNA